MNIYYVYIYLDPRKPGRWETSLATFLYEPIYVGEGKNNRMYDHLGYKENTLKCNKIQKIIREGHTPIIIKLVDGLDGDEGIKIESNLIKDIGTVAILPGIKRGPLTNMVLYDGPKLIISNETKKKLSANTIKLHTGLKRSEETKKKISNSYNRTPEAYKNRSKAQKNRILSEETKENIKNLSSKQWKGIPKTEEQKIKMSKAGLGKKKSRTAVEKIRLKNLSKWIIKYNENTYEITDLTTWCKENNINYSSLKTTYRRGDSYKGYTLTKHD